MLSKNKILLKFSDIPISYGATDTQNAIKIDYLAAVTLQMHSHIKYLQQFYM